MPTITQRIERIFEECSGIWGVSGVSSWERERLEEWRGRTSLSPKQEAIVADIEERVIKEKS